MLQGSVGVPAHVLACVHRTQDSVFGFLSTLIFFSVHAHISTICCMMKLFSDNMCMPDEGSAWPNCYATIGDVWQMV
jgi:hypothetical protein